MRNNYNYASNQTTRSSSGTGDLLLAPADAYDFQRAMSTESTETVRAGKLVAATNNNTNNYNANTTTTMANHHLYHHHHDAGCDDDDDDEISPNTASFEEDRVPVSSPKKLPATPPREKSGGDSPSPRTTPGCHERYIANLVPPSSVVHQQPRLVPRPFLRTTPSSSWRFKEEDDNNIRGSSIFRASPLLDTGDGDGPSSSSSMALSREHPGFYTLQRSLAFDDDEC